MRASRVLCHRSILQLLVAHAQWSHSRNTSSLNRLLPDSPISPSPSLWHPRGLLCPDSSEAGLPFGVPSKWPSVGELIQTHRHWWFSNIHSPPSPLPRSRLINYPATLLASPVSSPSHHSPRAHFHFHLGWFKHLTMNQHFLRWGLVHFSLIWFSPQT